MWGNKKQNNGNKTVWKYPKTWSLCAYTQSFWRPFLRCGSLCVDVNSSIRAIACIQLIFSILPKFTTLISDFLCFKNMSLNFIIVTNIHKCINLSCLQHQTFCFFKHIHNYCICIYIQLIVYNKQYIAYCISYVCRNI